jgi:MOSC domain-containing protein YiiM
MNPQRHATADFLAAGLANIRQSPKDGGTVDLIVVRPASGERMILDSAQLTPESGVLGDRWQATAWKKLPDGSPDPAIQVTLMNSRCIALIAGDEQNWATAGDNLFVDMDLSKENLPVGTQLAIGECIVQIAQPAHNGCHKFRKRFGADAVKFVNSQEGKVLRLRGVHARVVHAGSIHVGDKIHRLPATPNFKAGEKGPKSAQAGGR